LQGAAQVAGSLRDALNRQRCQVRNLILLDGLELPANAITFNGGRLVELGEDFLNTWFRGTPPPGPVAPHRLTGVAALETVTEERSPPWGVSLFEWDSAATRTKRAAKPWSMYLNLLGSGKCMPIGMYQHSDSQLHLDEWRAVGVEEPMWEPRHHFDGVDDYESEELYRTLYVDDDGPTLATFLNQMDAGRSAAERRTHRVETALRFFDRVCDDYMGHHQLEHGDDMDANEDLVIDAVAGLEAIFLAKEKRGKGQVIGARAAAVLEANVTKQRAMRKEVEDLYELRSAILHGDARAASEDLRKGATSGEHLLRRSIIAFCRLQGDHQRLVDAAKDPATAQTVRQITLA
jgi:hypothetical protein